MDNLTHSLVGALLGQAGLKRRTGLAMPALIIGANLPDVDISCVPWGIESLAMRRGLTHGPIAWVLLPLLLTALLVWFDRWQTRRGTRPGSRAPVRPGWVLALSFIACMTHPALDWLNSYGIRLLAPFSQKWFYGDSLFIIDPWLWATLGMATWLSLRREKRALNWRRPALVGLVACLAYINTNIVISGYAAITSQEPLGYPKKLVTNPVPLAFWQRDMLYGSRDNWSEQRWTLGSGLSGDAEGLARTDACESWPLDAELAVRSPDLAAFLFWSRMPFTHPVEVDGKPYVRFGDARFVGYPVDDRFSVDVPVSACEFACQEELAAPCPPLAR